MSRNLKKWQYMGSLKRKKLSAYFVMQIVMDLKQFNVNFE